VTAGDDTREVDLSVVVAYPSDSWQDLAPLPEGVRYMELVSDGEALYAIGGMYLDEENEQWVPIPTVMRWDPGLNGWDDSAAADLPVDAAGGGACFMDGKIYYAGGYDGPAEDNVHWSFQPDLLIYDVGADTWTSAGPLPMKTSQAAVTCNGAKVYVVNGRQDLDDNGALVTASEDGADGTAPRLQIYDAAGDAWSEGAPPLNGATSAAAVVLDGTLILAGGTFDNPDDPSTSLVTRGTQLYDISGAAWDADGPLLSNYRADMGAALFRDTLCVVGGTGTEAALDTWECFTGESWVVQVDSVPVPCFGNGAAGMGDFIYSAGGELEDGLTVQAMRWPTGDLGEPFQPEPTPDTGGDPDVVVQPDTPGPGEDSLIPGDDTAVLPGDDTGMAADTTEGDISNTGGGGGGGGGGGCTASATATHGILPLLLALSLVLWTRRRRVMRAK
jgi:N-acetylneuraminic acid mutarotase